MSRKALGIAHLRGRHAQRWARNKYDARGANTAKARRDRRVTAPVPALVDPMRTLGHLPRPRRRRRRRAR